MAFFAPPRKVPPDQWAEANREMPEGSPIPGRFSFRITPYLIEPLRAVFDPTISRVVFRKSAQIGWTDGVVLNAIGAMIDLLACRILVLFPREKTAIDFNDEKLVPMIESVPALAAKIDLKSKAAGNRQLFKKYKGGFLKLIASNAPGDVKSTSSPIVFVEEPDDCNKNVKNQGTSIKLAEERIKTFHDGKIVEGGTPTVEGISEIDSEFEKSDRRLWFVPCHECNEAAPLEFENLRWTKDEANPHPIYGKHQPETARYACPSCGALWNDSQKNRNVRRAWELRDSGKTGWIPTAPFTGIAGFHANELVSPFPKSAMSLLAAKKLDAVKKARAGDFSDLIAFTNSSMAKSWAYASSVPKGDALRARAEDYAEQTVPVGGLILVMGMDVQHDRLAICLWAFGRGEEMWLIWWGEIHGRTVDPTDPVWEEADAVLLRTYRHVTGAEIFVEACSIDTGDGQTSDAAYTWVRRHRRHGRKVMACKGPSDTHSNREIYAVPAAKSVDHRNPTKAEKYGLKVFMVGNQKAQDLLLGHSENAGRINLKESGPGRMHWYKGVRDDFFAQITSHVRAPWKGTSSLIWQVKSGQRDEALDTTILCLHASRSLNAHRMTDANWTEREKKLAQVDMLPKSSAPSDSESTGSAGNSEAQEEKKKKDEAFRALPWTQPSGGGSSPY